MKFLGFGGLCRRNYHRELKPQEVGKQNHWHGMVVKVPYREVQVRQIWLNLVRKWGTGPRSQVL